MGVGEEVSTHNAHRKIYWPVMAGAGVLEYLRRGLCVVALRWRVSVPGVVDAGIGELVEAVPVLEVAEWAVQQADMEIL